MNNEIMDLTMWASGIFMVLVALNGFLTFHLWDKITHLKDDVQELKASLETSRDRVTYLYDQVNRVETKVDVKDQIEQIVQEALEANKDD